MAENADIQRQLDELRRELLDTRVSTINWWLAVNGFILTFFGIVVVIGGYVGFSRFQEIEIQARGYLSEIKEIKEASSKAMEDLHKITSKVIDDPNRIEQVNETVKKVRQDPKASLLDLAIANASTLQRTGKIDEAIEKWRSIAKVAEGTDDQLATRAWFSVGYLLGKTGNQQESVSAYDEAVRLKPDSLKPISIGAL